MSDEIKMPGFDILKNIQVIDDERYKEYEDRQEAEKEKERKAELEENYRKHSGAPKRYLCESLETYKPSRENEGVFKWLKGFTDAAEKKSNTKNLLYLSGEFGTGKTHLGCGIVRRLGGMIITSLELCITYDSCRDFNAPMTRIQFLKNLCSQKVLVVDETGQGIQAIERLIYPYLVNEFYGSGNLLVFLGNIGKSDFEKTIGASGADRFAEVGVYCSLVGQSHRKSGK